MKKKHRIKEKQVWHIGETSRGIKNTDVTIQAICVHGVMYSYATEGTNWDTCIDVAHYNWDEFDDFFDTLVSDPDQPWLPLPDGYRLVTDEERAKYWCPAKDEYQFFVEEWIQANPSAIDFWTDTPHAVRVDHVWAEDREADEFITAGLGGYTDFDKHKTDPVAKALIDTTYHTVKSAYDTLENLGYTYGGGTLWKPPIGEPTAFDGPEADPAAEPITPWIQTRPEPAESGISHIANQHRNATCIDQIQKEINKLRYTVAKLEARVAQNEVDSL